MTSSSRLCPDLQAVVHRPERNCTAGEAGRAAPPAHPRRSPSPPPPPTSRLPPLTPPPAPRSFGVITSQDVEGPVDFKFSLVRSGGDHATAADHVIVPQFDFTFLHFHTMMVDEDGDPAPTSMAVSFEQADGRERQRRPLCAYMISQTCEDVATAR